MKTYRNSQEIKGKILKIGDKIIVPYPIHRWVEGKEIKKFLICRVSKGLRGLFLGADFYHNDKIFRLLEIITKEEIDKFCMECYQYKPFPGCFPETINNDNPAITRVTLALIQRAELFVKERG
jgi:hypothetical protein